MPAPPCHMPAKAAGWIESLRRTHPPVHVCPARYTAVGESYAFLASALRMHGGGVARINNFTSSRCEPPTAF